MTSRRELYAMGEPFGDSATQEKPFGRIYGGGGGGGGTTTTTPQIAPELRPLANLYTQQAQQLAATPWQAYSGQRFADLNSTQNLAIGMIQDRALNGDPTVNAGANFIQHQLNTGPATATVNPYAQQGNPYLDQAVQKAQDSVKSNFNTAAVNSGSFGNSGLQQQYADGLTDVATRMYGDAWNTQAQLGESQASRNDAMFQNSMGQKLNAAQLGLNYGNQAYQDAGQLLNAGNLQQQQVQNNLDFGYQQYQDAQNNPYKKLQTIGGVVGQAQGSTTTTSGGGK